jgi:hypothetical protein
LAALSRTAEIFSFTWWNTWNQECFNYLPWDSSNSLRFDELVPVFSFKKTTMHQMIFWPLHCGKNLFKSINGEWIGLMFQHWVYKIMT